MSIEKKNKLIYSGELIIIAIVFLVIGILELLKIIKLSDNFQLIFKILTLIGASWVFTDFFWTIFSKKRKARNSLLDKIMMLPLAIYLVVFDIIGFAIAKPYDYYQIGVPLAFFYIACAYIFQGIYHYYNPIPLILEAIEEEKAAKEEKEKQESNQENTDIENKEEQ